MSTWGELAETVIKNLSEKIQIIEVDSEKMFEPKIIKVSGTVRKGHDDAYEPELFSIGPYHRKPSPMEETKFLYLHRLLARDKTTNQVSYYVNEIVTNLKRARQQYSDPIQMSDEAFVEMLVVDGCFIIELLLKYAQNESLPNSRGRFAKICKSPTLRRDLLLLENQIPFFILDIILQNSNYYLTGFPQGTTTVIDLALNYLTKGRIKKEMLFGRTEGNIYHLLHLSYLCLCHGLAPQNPNTRASKETSMNTNLLKKSAKFIKHFVSHFLIYFLYYLINVIVILFLWRNHSWYVSNEKNSKKQRIPPTASELKEAGVTFKKKDVSCYLDVSFDDEGILHMPLLSVQHRTNSMFRNLLAFEQNYSTENTFGSYVILINSMIDTSSDVNILKQHGVLESTLGCDHDVAELFNQLGTGLVFGFKNENLKDMSQKLHVYCNQKYNRWRAMLMHDYFSNPWKVFSIIAALLLLVLTMVQTVYTVK